MGHDLDSLPPLDEQNAIMLSAVFDSADPAYGKFSTKYIDLQA